MRGANLLLVTSIIVLFGWWSYVKFFGTGYESSGVQHFIQVVKGVNLELGNISRNPPTSADLQEALSEQMPVTLPNGSLLRAAFGKGDREFYVFVKPISDDHWRVIHKPKTDYKGFTKVWVTKISLKNPAAMFLIAATGTQSADVLFDGQILRTLPEGLSYSRVYMVKN